MTKKLRIISLLPSATEIVAALGLIDCLVGISHECDYPPAVQNLPICTEATINSNKTSAKIDADIQSLLQATLSIYKIKTDVIEKLQPTHIITQDQCDVCAVSFGEVQKAVAQLIHSNPEIISLQPNTLNDIWADIERVANTLEIESQPLLNQLQLRVNNCQQKIQSLSSETIPKVAAIEWTEPLMATGNWIPELVTIAGGKCLFGVVGQHSPYLQWESLIQANPDVIIIMPCGFNLERTRQESQILTQHPSWSNLQAVNNNKVFITDGNSYFNRPGPRLVDSLEILAEILHPNVFNYGYQGVGWQPLTIDK